MENIGKIIFVAGLLIVVTGLVIWLLGTKLNWFGNLPGDIKIEKEKFRFYAPLVSMLILSVFLSLIFWIAGKFFK